MSIAAKDVSDLYNFIVQCIDDAGNIILYKKRQKFNIYKSLLDSIRLIHYDYIRILLNLHGHLIKAKERTEIEEAKENFLNDRLKYAACRSVTKYDAKRHLGNSKDIVEARFLFSIFWFLYYGDEDQESLLNTTTLDLKIFFVEDDDRGGDSALNTPSSSLWSEIEHDHDRDSLIKKILRLKSALDSKYATISTCYSDLELHWKYGHPAITSAASGLLEKFGIGSPADEIDGLLDE